MSQQFDFHVKKDIKSDTTAVYPMSKKAKELIRNCFYIPSDGDFKGAAIFTFSYNPFGPDTLLSESGLTYKLID